jgi:glycosyltransferase involved in cell wall biosynthesis
MKQYKVTFIAQFPPPIHGLSKAIETLWNSNLRNKYSLRKINITGNIFILKNFITLILTKSDLFYFTISQTKMGNWRDLLILKLLEWKKKKCLIHLHGGYYRELIEMQCSSFQRKLNYKAIKKVDGCIVLSESLKFIFQDLIENDKIHVVPNCVDNEYIPDKDNLERKWKDMSRIHILYLSNFIETKGYKDVLSLACMAKEKGDSYLQFHFAGHFFQHSDKIYFESFIKENNLFDYVKYHGIVSGQSKSELLDLCHIFILLTRYPNEGQPISILEAMANSMVIITTNHAGIPDIVKNEINGLIVDKNLINLNLIYGYVINFKHNRQKLVNIGINNYIIAKSNYTEEQYINNLSCVFNTLLSS